MGTRACSHLWVAFYPACWPSTSHGCFAFQNQQAFPQGLTQEAHNILYLKPIKRLSQSLRCLGQGLFVHNTCSLLPQLSQEGHHFTSLIICTSVCNITGRAKEGHLMPAAPRRNLKQTCPFCAHRMAQRWCEAALLCVAVCSCCLQGSGRATAEHPAHVQTANTGAHLPENMQRH